MSPLDARPVAGDVAPPFALRDADGVERALSAAAGSWLVLYFYQKTTLLDARLKPVSFEMRSALQEAGAIVWG